MAEQFVQINVTGPRATRLTYTSPGMAQLESLQLSELKEENILLKTLFSGISRGTESLVFSGLVPKSEWNRMQCPFMSGSFSYPITYGYACVGEVIAKGHSVANLELGDHVFVLHPHQDMFHIPEASCNPLPNGLPAKRAVLAANMETALNAIWDAEISGKPSCAVIGAGVVGLTTAYVAKKVAGLDPVIFDVNPAKQKKAEALGLGFTNPHDLNTNDLPGFDLLFHTTASQSGLQSAINMASFEGTIIEMSWYGEKPVSLQLGGAFHSKRLKIMSSQVGTIAPAKRNKMDYSGRMRKAISLLDDQRLDTLLEPAIDFHDLPNHLHDIFSPQSKVLCQVVEYKA